MLVIFLKRRFLGGNIRKVEGDNNQVNQGDNSNVSQINGHRNLVFNGKLIIRLSGVSFVISLFMFLIFVLPFFPLRLESLWSKDSAQQATTSYLEEGIQRLEEGKLNEAETFIEKASKETLGTPEPLYWKARVAMARKKNLVALELTEKALQLNNRHVPSLVLKIKLLLLSGGEDRRKAKTITHQSYGISEDLDVWLECLERHNIFSLLVITSTDLENNCPMQVYKQNTNS